MLIREFLSPGIEAHPELNSLLWSDQGQLDPMVRSHLIKIANHFKRFVDLDFEVLDLQITGGQTSRYWTNHSDLDLHLITDYTSIDCDQELAELFDTKRLLYKQQHKIEIRGIPVELYVEDSREPAVGGAYSLIRDQWVRPSTEPQGPLDLDRVAQYAARWQQIIQATTAINDIDQARKVMSVLKDYRRKGLARSGEYGVANLVFKSLRNSGLVDQLRQQITDLEDGQLSL
jgi:hypothetical protein